MASPDSNPALSIVVATRQPWPGVRALLESVAEQAREVGAEIIVADGGPGALPEGPPPRGARWLREWGASVLRLRALGLTAARGGVVAVTEDHCRVDPAWCSTILELHRAAPEVAAIGGAVENAATGTVVSRLHFLTAYGVFMRPLPKGEARSIAGEANVSYKRSALPPEPAVDGLQQMLFNQRLVESGHRVATDDRIVVFHDQPVPLTAACRLHFHNGRCIAGFRSAALSPLGRVARVASCLVLPPFLALRAVAASLRKRRERAVALLGLPILLALGGCHAVGELAGYLGGAGESPSRIA